MCVCVCMCVCCFCLLVPKLLCLAFEHVHWAIDLGRAFESWAPFGETIGGWIGHDVYAPGNGDLFGSVWILKRERQLHCETSGGGTISSSVFKRSVAWERIDRVNV